MPKIGPIIPDRVSSSSSAKQSPQFIKAQVENAERQAAAKPKQIVNSIVPTVKPSVPASLKPPAAPKPVAPKPVIPSWPNGFDGMTGNRNYSNTSSTPAPTSGKTSTPVNEPRLYSPANMDSAGAFVSSSPVVAAVPAVPQPVPAKEDKSIKSASPDIILVDQNDLPIDLILKLTLEKIGAQELISLVRHDTVNGQNIVYQPVKNISDVAISYNPQNIINIPDTAEIYFKNFAIKMENHILQDTNETPPESVYIDPVSGNIVVETVNLKSDYEVEVQMISSGQIFNDTIYEEDVS